MTIDFTESLVDAEIKLMPQPSAGAEKIIADSLGISEPSYDVDVSDDIEPSNSNSNLIDSGGTHFDPSIHAADGDGNPKLTITGKFRKRPGRKSGDSPNPKSDGNLASKEAGRATAETIFFLGQNLFGDEWVPVYEPKQGINERQQMIDAWASYYEATGKTEMPPWVVVAIACSCYVLPRLGAPKTKERMNGYFGGIKQWFTNRRNKKRLAKDKK